VAVLAALLVVVGACTSDSAEPSPRPAVRSPTSEQLALTDVAGDVGLDFRHGAFRWSTSADPGAMLGAGVCWLDYDRDGWLDLFAVNSYALSESERWDQAGNRPRSALWHNERGEFVDVSSGSGADLAVRGNGCVAADLDLDGDTDLYVTTATNGVLLWNRGNGTFTDGTSAAGVDAFGWRAAAAVGDVNGDRWPDLFVAGYADLNIPLPEATRGFPNTYAGVRDLLYLSNGPDDAGRVTFREVGKTAGLEVVNFEYGLGALFSDFNRDGDLDLYVANDTNPNRLYDNVAWPGGAEADPARLGFRFEELAGEAGVADPNSGMGVAAADFDADARNDLFITNARGQLHAAFASRARAGAGPSFEDVPPGFAPELAGSTGWGISWGDLDLDTDLDLVLVNGDIPVRNLRTDGRRIQAFGNLSAQGRTGDFTDIGARVGLDQVGRFVARGSSMADYDNDGDLDVAINSIGGQLVLLENTGVVGNWLEVDLAGFAPGALITAVLPGGRELIREWHAGSSYLSSEDPRCHFGLGTAAQVSELVVTWPNGEETVIADVRANQLITVEPPA
jgi:hypothetical protein